MLSLLRASRWCSFGVLLVGFLVAESRSFAQAFQADINRWTTQDALDPPIEGAILFTGSSSIRRYEQLTRDFSDYHVLQRGFGGSQFEDLNGFVDDIVIPYNPGAIVVFEGTNDTASGESSAEVFADYQNFVNLVHTSRPGTPIFFLGIAATPGRFDCCQVRNAEINASVANFAASNPALHYIDLPSAFNALNPPDGPDFRALFVDSIHLNRQGYDLWTSVIKPQLETVIAPNKAFTPNPNTPLPGDRILFDFGPSNSQDGDQTLGPDQNGNIWNNWHQAQGGVEVNAGEHLGNLVNTSGDATGVNLTITGGFSTNGKLHGGLLAPDAALLGDLAIATATQDYFESSADNRLGRGSDDRPGGFMLDGLDPTLIYDFHFFGSAISTEPRTTEYLVVGANSKSVLLQTSGPDIGADGVYDGNDDEIALVSGIRPDEFGQIFIDITLTQGRTTYLSALEITVSVPEPTAATSAVISLFLLSMFSHDRKARPSNEQGR